MRYLMLMWADADAASGDSRPTTADNQYCLKLQLLARSLGRLDGLVQFVLGGAQMLFRLDAVSVHVVVVGRAGSFHFVDGFLHVVMDCLQVAPIASLANCNARNK